MTLVGEMFLPALSLAKPHVIVSIKVVTEGGAVERLKELAEDVVVSFQGNESEYLQHQLVAFPTRSKTPFQICGLSALPAIEDSGIDLVKIRTHPSTVDSNTLSSRLLVRNQEKQRSSGGRHTIRRNGRQPLNLAVNPSLVLFRSPKVCIFQGTTLLYTPKRTATRQKRPSSKSSFWTAPTSLTLADIIAAEELFLAPLAVAIYHITNTVDSYTFANFQSNLHGNIDGEASSHTIPTFLALYIFGFLYQLLLVYDALRLKNTIQVIGLCFYNVGLLIYAAVQMDQIDEAIEQLGPKHIDASVWDVERPYLIAIPCIIGLGTVLMAVIAWKLYDEFAWTIYKHISADLKMKRRYLTYQVSNECAINF
ncbi:MAG: hypothetical protein Q9213_006536 [Squamulea squamosa]